MTKKELKAQSHFDGSLLGPSSSSENKVASNQSSTKLGQSSSLGSNENKLSPASGTTLIKSHSDGSSGSSNQGSTKLAKSPSNENKDNSGPTKELTSSGSKLDQVVHFVKDKLTSKKESSVSKTTMEFNVKTFDELDQLTDGEFLSIGNSFGEFTSAFSHVKDFVKAPGLVGNDNDFNDND